MFAGLTSARAVEETDLQTPFIRKIGLWGRIVSAALHTGTS